MSRPPMVTVGVPVRNGAATLRAALQSVLDQTYTDLEVLVSDNGSTDDTPAIVMEFAAVDSRVRYVRHDPALTVWQNFRFLVGQARGHYFMWAADDDLRNEKYVELLVRALDDHPRAVLAYGDVVWFSTEEERAAAPRVTYEFGWEGLSYHGRLRKVLLSKCSEIYGLFRTDVLRRYRWLELDYGADIPMLLYLRLLGDFVHADDATLYEWRPAIEKEPGARARRNFYRPLRRFRVARLAWGCMLAAGDASRRRAQPVNRLHTLVGAYAIVRWDRSKIWLYAHLPPGATRLWRRWKPAPDLYPSAARITAQEAIAPDS